MGSTYNVWSEEDAAILRDLFERGVPFCDIVTVFPHKTYQQVRGKVSVMKLVRPSWYKAHLAPKAVNASLAPEHVMWDEHPASRRTTIISKASRGAREALKAMGAI